MKAQNVILIAIVTGITTNACHVAREVETMTSVPYDISIIHYIDSMRHAVEPHFYADNPDGKRLYYKVVDSLSVGFGTVLLATPNGERQLYAGRIVVPDTILFNEMTYKVTGLYHVPFRENPFFGMPDLTEVVLPDGITELPYLTFFRCFGLTSIQIGTGLKQIDSTAFAWCQKLTDITILCTTPPTIVRTIEHDNDFMLFDQTKCTLHVPQGTAHLYRQAEGWKDFGQIIEE